VKESEKGKNLNLTAVIVLRIDEMPHSDNVKSAYFMSNILVTNINITFKTITINFPGYADLQGAK
jgi:hypothetical protein